jgi:hypothetical protein
MVKVTFWRTWPRRSAYGCHSWRPLRTAIIISNVSIEKTFPPLFSRIRTSPEVRTSAWNHVDVGNIIVANLAEWHFCIAQTVPRSSLKECQFIVAIILHMIKSRIPGKRGARLKLKWDCYRRLNWFINVSRMFHVNINQEKARRRGAEEMIWM